MTDLRAQLEAGLASRYRIERELGRGGMATVYLAHDLRHDRPVALKVLHPHLGHALGPERFQREIRLAARLQHPNILTVHDSGELPGPDPLLYFTMPFIEGESLRDRLAREKQLPLDDAVRISREAAEALEHAHRHGVVHRDVKPENILLAAGHAMVADFGIARALSSSNDEHLTSTGMSIGTAAYMSPEQAAGEKDVDARSDVYSLATVLYEMLTGQVPFAASTPQVMIARRFTEVPRPVRELRDSVPAALEAAVAKGLARMPADRFASAEAFSAALSSSSSAVTASFTPIGSVSPRRRIPIGLATLAVGFLLGVGVLFAWKTRTGGGGADTRLVAVLPFENLGDTSDAYFVDGITDEVRNKLGTVPGIEVIARGSSEPYRGAQLTPKQIANELGVRYLLTGTVRRVKTADGEQVMVRPELVEVSGGRPPKARWGESIDASASNVFQVQADIAGHVARALGAAFGSETRKQVAEWPTKNLAAYDAYLRGLAITNASAPNDPGAARRAVSHFTEAVELDPNFALAWARLSRSASLVHAAGAPNPDDAERARVAAKRALELAPDLPDGYIAMGDYLNLVRGDGEAQAAQLRTALRFAPGDVTLLLAVGANLRVRGFWDSALALQMHAAELDPRSARPLHGLSYTLTGMRRYDEADAAIDRAIALGQSDIGLVHSKVVVSLGRGDLAGARARIADAVERHPPGEVAAYLATFEDLGWALDSAHTLILLRLGPSAFDDDRASRALALADAYALRSDRQRAAAYADTAAREFADQIEQAPEDPQLPVLRAVALAMAGRFADAIAEGERAVALLPSEKHAVLGPYVQHQLVRIHIMAGNHDEAIELLEPLLRMPYTLSPGWLRIDPHFDPLRGNPRFERLTHGAT